MYPLKQPVIAPSILSADFACLGREIQEVAEGGADWIHIDVMDGHFVPNLTLGPQVVRDIRKVTQLPLDCHLMVSEPEKWIGFFAEAGADWITVHVEATQHLHRLLNQIRETGAKVGVSLNPSTPLGQIEEVLDEVDMVLVMSVNPGYGGQKFIQSSLSKIQRLHKLRADRKFLIQVDGGVSGKNIEELRKAGVDAFVVGSAIFSSTDRKKAILELKSQVKRVSHSKGKMK